MDFRPLLTLHFWFDLTPPPFLPGLRMGFMIFFGLFAVATIGVLIVRSFARTDEVLGEHLDRWVPWLLLLTLWGWGIVFVTEERVAFFSARFWFLIWLVVAVWWGYYLVRDANMIRSRRAKIAAREQFRKYLPRKKK